ncbi:MAG: hypothetical protein M0Z61_12280 [Nitrospiraceae bacterium]|nr:hypothetical protein [Nitrospiraceae bacterium]
MAPDSFAPIALFVYNRPWHTRQTVEALKKNELAAESDLFIFSDGPKNAAFEGQVKAVRDYLRTIDGFRAIHITERNENYGLAKSIIGGVSEVISRFGKIIVMEDDLVSSKYFLKFMNEALNFYENEENVASISGYMYPLEERLPASFFLRGAECWGWATWRRGWNVFEADGKKLIQEIHRRKLKKIFDVNGAYGYTKMLQDQIAGKNDSWAVRWHASVFLKDMLTLYPGASLILNIGFDGSGTHCGRINGPSQIQISEKSPRMKQIPVTENKEIFITLEKFLKRKKGSLPKRLKNRIVRIFKTR